VELLTELQEIQWLTESAKDLPGHGYTGYSAGIGEASTWILHAMYESQSDIPDITHDEWHHLQVERGVEEPLIVPGLNPESVTILGIPIGRTTRPTSNYKRLRWSERASQVNAPMASSGVPPCFRWFPDNSWPVRIRPPPKGRLTARVTFYSFNNSSQCRRALAPTNISCCTHLFPLVTWGVLPSSITVSLLNSRTSMTTTTSMRDPPTSGQEIEVGSRTQIVISWPPV
jgi:hypothetical protein